MHKEGESDSVDASVTEEKEIAISLATQNVEKDFEEYLTPCDGAVLQSIDTFAVQRRDAFAVQRGLDARRAKLRNRRLKADIDLSKKLARWSMWTVGLLLLFTYVGLILYILLEYLCLKEKPDTAVLITWITSSVAETIGIVLVIARYLFPNSAFGKFPEDENDDQ
jgi:hypothetical protein